jgi:hypothetical protein
MHLLADHVSSHPQNASNRCRRYLRAIRTVPGILLLLCVVAWAQTSDDNSKPWSATSDTQDSNLGSRTRKTESHSQVGNRSIDKQSTEILRSGRYEPYQETERESVKVNETTTRTVVRTFGRDSSRNRVLLQTTEEEQQNLPDGGAKVTRSTSNPDANGRSQIVQRVVQETKKRAANVEETTTTTFLPGVNGGMTAAMKVHERQEHTGEHTVKVQKSTLLPDGAGNWQTSETKQSTITDDGNSRTTEESVSRTGGDGRLTEVSRTIGKESGNGSGNGQSTVETYSVDVPGSSSDGRMHLMQRVTTTNREGLSGSHATQQQVQQINPGDPGAGLQVTVQSTDTQTVGASGTHNARTIQMRGGDGSLNTVSVDMSQSDRSPPVQVQVSPPAKPAPATKPK